MSSEAAQKAYLARLPYNAAFERAMVQQEAFDAGAVEALRRAAATLGVDTAEGRDVLAMADEWERGSA